MSLRQAVVELVGARELLVQLTLRDIKIRYKQTAMGLAWALLVPMLVVLAGAVVRLAMTQAQGGDVAAAALGGVAVKSIPWAFVVGALAFATNSLTSNATLVSKVHFAREVLPISAVLAQLVDSSVAAVLVALLLPFMGGTMSAALLWVPVLALILIIFVAGAGLFLSCANLFFRDVKYIVQAVTMFGIFFTPILYDASELGPTGSKLIMFNPLSPVVEGLRLAVIDGHNLLTPLATDGGFVWEPWYLAYGAIWALLIAAAGVTVFHRAEPLFAEFV